MRWLAPAWMPWITPTTFETGRSTSSSSVFVSATERVARPSTCETATWAEPVMRANAFRSCSACADMRLVSSISSGSPASERFAVSIRARVWSIRRIAMIAIPTRAIVTTTMQIWTTSVIA